MRLTQVEQNRARIETAQVALDLARQRLEAGQNVPILAPRRFVSSSKNSGMSPRPRPTNFRRASNLTKALIDPTDRSAMHFVITTSRSKKPFSLPAFPDYKPANVSVQPAANQK